MLQKISSLIVTVLLITGCVAPQTRAPATNNDATNAEARKQQILVVEDYMINYKKLQNVSSRIITSGVDHCGEKTAGYYGFHYWNQDSFQSTWKEITKSQYDLDEKFKILHISEKSPAEKAALKEGDVIVSINQWLVPIGKDANKQLAQKLAEQARGFSPVEIAVLREGAEHKISITPVKSCDFQVHLASDDTKNAYADGKNIVVYKGMMDFFRTDEEMALVVSHELAHNAMQHIDAKKKNATAGSILGLILDIAAATAGVNTNGDFSRMGAGIAGNAYSVEFEQEADYVGLYIMQKAGFNIDNAAGFWRRMAVNNAQAITIKSSHPTTPERFVAIEETVKEIKGKIEKGVALNPELKK